MVKIKRATNIVQPKAAPLNTTLKKKAPKKVKAEKVEEENVPHIPLVALPKAEKPKPIFLTKEVVEKIVKKEKPVKNKKVKGAEKTKPLVSLNAGKEKKPAKAKSLNEAEKDKKSKQTAKKPLVSLKVENVEIKEAEKEQKVENEGKKQKKKPLVSVKIENAGKVQKPQAKKKNKAKNQKSAKDSKENQLINQVQEEVNYKLSVPAEELPTFNDDQFRSIVNVENITKIAETLKKNCEQEVKAKKNTLFTDFRYFLNVSCFKIPNCPKRMVKLNLLHSLVSKEDDDVLIIVPDLQRGSRIDHEPTKQHFTDLFEELGINELGYRLTIMPFNQLRQEYKTYESVRKLAATYEHYLCDGRVVGNAVGIVGKLFQKPRTTLHAVHFDKKEKLKDNIERAMRRTAFKQLHKGDLISIPVGNFRFTAQQLAENVAHVVEQLKEWYPGGWPNIRKMHLKIDIVGTSAMPIFLSNGEPPAHTPYVIGTREKRLNKLKREADKVLQKFELNKRGDLTKLTKDEMKKKQIAQEYRQILTSDVTIAEGEDPAGDDTAPTPAKKSKTSKEDENVNDDDEEEEDEEEEDSD